MHIDLNTPTPAAALEPSVSRAHRTCYTTCAPVVVDAIKAWERKQAAFNKARRRLGEVFGGVAVSFSWLHTQFIGGLKLGGGVEVDRHWHRPDRWGSRALRSRARIPRDMQVISPAAIHAEHDRLLARWARACPASIDASEVWQALGIHLGSVSLWGGSFFRCGDKAYLTLGFDLEQGQPGVTWLAEATPITPAEFEAARAQQGEEAA